MPWQGSWLSPLGAWYVQMQEVAGERGGYLHGRGGMLLCPLCFIWSSIQICLCRHAWRCFMKHWNCDNLQHWTAMIYFISRSRWKLKKMRSVFYAEQRNGLLQPLRYPSMFVTLDEHCPSLGKSCSISLFY